MSDFVRPSVWRKAAKPHVCEYCGEAINSGEIYQEQTGFWEGSAFRNRFHSECFQELCEEGEGEFMPRSNDRPEKSESSEAMP